MAGVEVERQSKGRVLVDALLLCLARSSVAKAIDVQTLRSVFESALGELWREGEFRLQPVWKILTSQPGVSSKELAPVMLVFKTLEERLMVQVRLPDPLASLPKSELLRLRDAIVVDADELGRAVAEIQAKAQVERNQAARAEQSAQAAQAASRRTPPPGVPARRTPPLGTPAVATPGRRAAI